MTQKKNSVSTPVKIGIPTLTVFADTVRVKFLLFKNTDAQLPGVVIECVKFTD